MWVKRWEYENLLERVATLQDKVTRIEGRLDQTRTWIKALAEIHGAQLLVSGLAKKQVIPPAEPLTTHPKGESNEE